MGYGLWLCTKWAASLFPFCLSTYPIILFVNVLRRERLQYAGCGGLATSMLLVPPPHNAHFSWCANTNILYGLLLTLTHTSCRSTSAFLCDSIKFSFPSINLCNLSSSSKIASSTECGCNQRTRSEERSSGRTRKQLTHFIAFLLLNVIKWEYLDNAQLRQTVSVVPRTLRCFV